VDEFGDRADASLRPSFEQAGLNYTPKRIAFLCFKEERRLELWGQDDGPWALVTDFEIKAASGKQGPKLKEGDRQVPEGIYRVEGLNPNSSYHLSIKLDYPNQFDVEHAKADGRASLGGDIFIHGKTASVGCLAMGDEVAERLFVLTSRVGKENVHVLIAPRDFRRQSVALPAVTVPIWLPELYGGIASELGHFQRPAGR
jgi:murein L,D-transpeptidase YafK